jgi:hypothetical protein
MTLQKPTKLRTFALPFSVFALFATLGCSGSNADGDEGGDNGGTAGSDTGGTSGESGMSGTGGSGMGGTGGIAPECMMDFRPTDPTALVDDIEDGNPLIATVGGRNGSWWITSDGTAGTITPPPDAGPPPERILGMRCESEFAMRITGQGFTTWGANLSIGFRYTTEEEPIDVSPFSGMMFWARVGETHNSPIRVQFQDSNTHPNGGICNATPGSADECYSGWGTELVPISSTWRLYQIEFSRMTQRDFGYRAETFDTTAVYGVAWDVAANSVFDLWVDDVWFYE